MDISATINESRDMKPFHSKDMIADRKRGIKIPEIARHYEVGQDFVRLFFREAALEPIRKWTPERNWQLTELVARGMSFGDIGIKMGCTRTAAIGQNQRLKSKAKYAAAQARRDTPIEPLMPDGEPAFNGGCVASGCTLTAQPGRDICSDHIRARYLERTT